MMAGPYNANGPCCYSALTSRGLLFAELLVTAVRTNIIVLWLEAGKASRSKLNKQRPAIGRPNLVLNSPPKRLRAAASTKVSVSHVNKSFNDLKPRRIRGIESCCKMHCGISTKS